MGRGRPVKRLTEALVRGGAIRPPNWLAAVRSTPPETPRSASKPGVIEYPEDALRKRFFERYPAARSLPTNLAARSDDTAHAVDKFVHAQLQLMQTEQLGEDEAFQKLEVTLALDPAAPQTLKRLLHSSVAEGLKGGDTFAALLPNGNLSDRSEEGRSQVFNASVEEARRDREMLDRMRAARQAN